MKYEEIPRTIDAEQVFKLSDHKALNHVGKYQNFYPVIDGAFAFVRIGYYDIQFVMPGDYIIFDNLDDEYQYTVEKKKDFDLKYKKQEND